MARDPANNLFSLSEARGKKTGKGRPCPTCASAIPAGKNLCKGCGAWSVGATGAKAPAGAAADGTVLLSQVTSKPVPRIAGTLFDLVVSGTDYHTRPENRGLPKTTVTLIGADPGTGKSTMCLAAGDEWLDQYPDRIGVYVVAEQSVEEFRGLGDRTKFRHPDRLRLVEAFGNTNILLEIDKWFDTYKPLFLVIDSLQRLMNNDEEASKDFCNFLKLRAAKHHCPILVICQVTKDGDLAGVNGLQHDVDCLLWMDLLGQARPVGDQKLGEGDKIVELRCPAKNRNGPTPRSVILRMLPDGSNFREASQADQDELIPSEDDE